MLNFIFNALQVVNHNRVNFLNALEYEYVAPSWYVTSYLYVSNRSNLMPNIKPLYIWVQMES